MVGPAAETRPRNPADRFGDPGVGWQSGSCDGGSRQSFAGGAAFHFSADAGLSAARQQQFKAHFAAEAAVLEAWSVEENWPPIVPCPPLRIFVSGKYRISKSLVPAWSGDVGRMEFPAWRVTARKAAILHELVHVYFPNANRLLAEGLAIYLQAKIGGNPAFPNFGRSLHAIARRVAGELVPAFVRGDAKRLDDIRLADLDAIATPSPLELRVGRKLYGEDPHGQARIYPIAGSFVQFLVETYGMARFRALYLQSPLVAGRCDAGSRERWTLAYGLSLRQLEVAWKTFIAQDSGGARRPIHWSQSVATMSEQTKRGGVGVNEETGND